MYKEHFTRWSRWENRNSLEGKDFPGIYIVAISDIDIAGQRFAWSQDIIYIGMTNAVAGLKGRLKQFDNTIRGKRGHGGADRVRYKISKI